MLLILKLFCLIMPTQIDIEKSKKYNLKFNITPYGKKLY